MIKLLALFLCLVFIAGCSNNENNNNPPEVTPNGEGVDAEPEVAIDIDLTRLSSTMASAQIENIFLAPHEYFNKVLKMQGEYSPWTDPVSGIIFHQILTDCPTGCPKGFVIRHNDEDFVDYPAEGAIIQLVGAFGLYDEGGYTDIPYLAVDDIVIVE
jgi:hypothetical protein